MLLGISVGAKVQGIIVVVQVTAIPTVKVTTLSKAYLSCIKMRVHNDEGGSPSFLYYAQFFQ